MNRSSRNLPPLPGTSGTTGAFSMVTATMLLLSILMQMGVRPPWQMQFPELPTAPITVGGEPLVVDVAIEMDARVRGLGYRPGLQDGTGMLFIDDTASIQGFWMKGMRFCLDIIWIDGDSVVGAAQNACPDPAGTADADRASFASPGPVRYVVEVPGGWMEQHGIEAGAPVTGILEATERFDTAP